MELLPLGPVVITDTPGLDDDTILGEQRIEKTYGVLNKTDIAVVVIDITLGKTGEDIKIIESIKDKKIPYIIVYNKSDLVTDLPKIQADEIIVSAKTGDNIFNLKEKIASLKPQDIIEFPIVADQVEMGDLVVLVIPIDSSAPKGRLILPQQQTIRELLECGAITVAVRETELERTLNEIGKKPKLVITDSQAFNMVAEIVPEDIPLTSFSILFARHKGDLKTLVEGASVIDKLNDGDTVLISEGCTHHRQCEDIGTVKLPRWIKQHTGKEINYEFTSGTEFPTDLSKYKLIIHCGGCMLNEREMKHRITRAGQSRIPMTNYGTAIAHLNGILKRSLAGLIGKGEN